MPWRNTTGTPARTASGESAVFIATLSDLAVTRVLRSGEGTGIRHCPGRPPESGRRVAPERAPVVDFTLKGGIRTDGERHDEDSGSRCAHSARAGRGLGATAADQ